ncbi:MAG: TatD family hydrolase [Verrucomicrobiota bacterium]
MLIDSHCHLASSTFEGRHAEVVEQAVEAGVGRLVTIGTDLEDSQRCVELAENFSEVYATVGIHPGSVHEMEDPDWLTVIRELAGHPKVVAIGEIGTDYFHPPAEGWTLQRLKATQEAFYIAQLELAAELGKNVVIHNRDSWEDTVRLIQRFHGRLRAVFHCYIGQWEEARPLVEKGHLISFTGIATFKNAPVVRAAATEAPLDSFMVETDSPYLAPEPHRGKRCHPAYTADTARAIARFREIEFEVLAEATTRTAETFYGIAGA